jgi:putative transposase
LRPVFAFFVVELGSRRVAPVGVTRSPTGAWAAQPPREATPEGRVPRFLVHDHDAAYGPEFDRLAAASGIEVLRTPIRAPRAKACASDCTSSVGWNAKTSCHDRRRRTRTQPAAARRLA